MSTQFLTDFNLLCEEYDCLESGTANVIDEYALRVFRLVRSLQASGEHTVHEATAPAAALRAILNDTEQPQSRRAIAFYMLAVHMRQHKQFSEWEHLLRYASRSLPGCALVPFQHAVYYKTVNPSESRLRLALEKWTEVDNRLLDSPAFGQAYADTVAALYFRGSGRIPEGAEHKDQIDRALAIATKAAIKRARAKTLNTHAKLLALRGDYERTTATVYEAIDLEERDRHDYALRIIEFESTLNRIEMIKSLSDQVAHIEGVKAETLGRFERELAERTADLNAKLDKSRVDLLTFMSLFAGVLALLITGGSLAQSADFATGASTLLILGAVLITVFSVLLLLIEYSKQRLYVTAGSLLTAAGLTLAAILMYAKI